MPKPKLPSRRWSSEELRLLSELYPSRSTKDVAAALERSVLSVYNAALKLELKKTAEYHRLYGFQKGSTIGRPFRFRKGNVPHNKGVRRPGWHSGRMRETQFKKNHRPQTWKPVGTIRADTEGYLRVKVRERRPGDAGGGWDKNVWPLLHHVIWREHHGPIPAKHVVTFKDRDRSNCSIDNLELISKAENARRNQMWTNLPRPLAEAIALNGAIKRKLREATSGKK
jgi:hypothetical protein